MKKILLLSLVFISFVASPQNRGRNEGGYMKRDSIRIGDSVITPAAIARYNAGGGGGITTIAAATDVNISSPSNLQLLQYQTSDNKWHNATIDFSRLTIYPSKYATAAALPTNTYDNGTSGFNAQLTATANGALTIDGSAVVTADTVLIKDEATPSHNGIYTVGQPGTGGTPYILTRAIYFDVQAEILTGSTTFVTGGSINANRTYTMNTPGSITVGTTDISWIQTGGTSGGGGIADPGSNGMLSRTALNVTAARTITGTTNKITVSQGDGVSGNPTLTVGSDIVDKTASTTYTAGQKQTFTPDATNPGFNWGSFASDPSTPANGDGWYNSTSNLYKGRWNGTVRVFASLDNTETFTNKTISLGSNTLTATLGQLSGAVTDDDVTGTTSVQEITNKRITKRIVTTSANNAQPTINTDNVDLFTVTGQSATITSMSANLSGSPNEGDELEIWITGTGSIGITWGASFAASSIALPTTTSGTSTLHSKFIRQSSLWVLKGYY